MKVLITGSSRGIGRCVSDLLKQTHHVIDTHYVNWRPDSLHLDVSNPHSIKDLVRQITDWYGGVDVLINNAGIAQRKDFMSLTVSDFDVMWNTNVRGAMLLTQQLLPYMLNQRFGKIINISSVGGITGGIEQVHYASTKAGLINFTKSITRLYANDGITCNCISPGPIKTDMTPDLTHTDSCDTINDVARLVEFLVNDTSINGQNIIIGGKECSM